MNNRASKILTSIIQIVIALSLCIVLVPPQWYSDALRLQLSEWFGVRDFQPRGELPFSVNTQLNLPDEEMCPEDLPGWRNSQNIEGVDIAASEACLVDNPYAVAALVRGTNNVATDTLLQAGLTADAVEKSNDLDGDGDPDEIHIRLEVVELNGGSPDMTEPVLQYSVAPGIDPGLWVFAPKSFGMATVNFESNQAKELLRSPSPTIRIEQGDRVRITLENTHYLPHTLHFHGVDHPFLDESGEGNDGTPVTSELPLQPGFARTYELQPRHPGTMFYHCHVQVQVHVMMGLQGMFVVEENRSNNWLQTLNIGAGHVRAPSVAVTETYDREYDLHFTDLDLDLNNLVQQSNDARVVEHQVNRVYDVTAADPELFTLNGKSFPFTFQESLIVAEPDQRIKMRVLNGGNSGLALHTHGHRAVATDLDGVSVPPGTALTRDVFWFTSAQRADLDLVTSNDGLHSYGSGVWLLHDHQGRSVTNNGLGPGGNLGAIVYREFLTDSGWPQTYGEDLARYFDPLYYQRISVAELSEEGSLTATLFLRLLALGLAVGFLAYGCVSLGRSLTGSPQ